MAWSLHPPRAKAALQYGDDSLPVQDNPIQSNHLLNNWREASPHTADPNLNAPTTWGRSSASGCVLKQRKAELLSKHSCQATVYSTDAAMLHKNTICMQGRPSSPQRSIELSMMWLHRHCDPIAPLPGWRQCVPAQLGTTRPGKAAVLHHSPKGCLCPLWASTRLF